MYVVRSKGLLSDGSCYHTHVFFAIAHDRKDNANPSVHISIGIWSHKSL